MASPVFGFMTMSAEFMNTEIVIYVLNRYLWAGRVV